MSAISSIASATHAPGGDRRGADPDAAGDEGAFRVEGDGVFVDGDPDLVQQPLRLLAGQTQVADIDQNQMVVRAAGNQVETRAPIKASARRAAFSTTWRNIP